MELDSALTVRGLVYVAISQAVNFLQQTGGELLPFTMIETAEKRTLRQFPADTFEEGLREARLSLFQSSQVLRGLVAWDGYVTLDGVKSDAILVEAYEAGSRHGLRFAQLYEKTGMSPNVVEPFGNVKYLADDVEPLF